MALYVVVVRWHGQAVPVSSGDWEACARLARITPGASVRPATKVLMDQLVKVQACGPKGPEWELVVAR